MMQGCTEPSSTLHPYAFAMAAHNITDPIGTNANATMMTSASTYQNHGNRLCPVAFISGILNHVLKVNVLLILCHDPALLGPFPQRGELSRHRLVRCLKMRAMIL